MSLVTTKEMLLKARSEGYAIGGFVIWSIDSVQAVIEASEKFNLPVLLMTGYPEAEYAGGFKNIYRIVEMVAESTKLPVALHADHFVDYETISEAIDSGFTSVMIDASSLPFKENIELTKKVVKLARRSNVTVEAELGRLAGSEAKLEVSEEQALQTDPEDAKRFVEETEIDSLAVAIGTVHGFYTYPPKINIDRLKAIAEKVSIPLVLHGGSGTPEEKVTESIKYGISKVNICTDFVAAMGRSIRDIQSESGFKYSVKTVFGTGRNAGRELAESKIKLFSGNK